MDIPEQQRRRYLRACRLFDELDEGVLARVAARAQGVLTRATRRTASTCCAPVS